MLELVIGLLAGTLGTLLFSLLLIPQKNQIAVKEMIFRRPQGIIEIISKGKDIITYTEDFSKSTTENGPKTEVRSYIINKEGIYRKNGIKTITFNELDASPIDLSEKGTLQEQKELLKEKLKDKALKRGKPLKLEEMDAISMDSGMLNALFMKMKTVAEATALKEVMEKIQQQWVMQIVIIVLVVIGIAISFQTFDKMNSWLEPVLNGIANSLKDLPNVIKR